MAFGVFLAASFLRLMRARRRFLLMTLLVCWPMVGSDKRLHFSDPEIRVKPLKRAQQGEISHGPNNHATQARRCAGNFYRIKDQVSQTRVRDAAGRSVGFFLESERRSLSAVSGLPVRLVVDSSRLPRSMRPEVSGVGALCDGAPSAFATITNASAKALNSECDRSRSRKVFLVAMNRSRGSRRKRA